MIKWAVDMLPRVQIRFIWPQKYFCWRLPDIINNHTKSYKSVVFYSVWRFQNEYGCSMLLALCFSPESFYVTLFSLLKFDGMWRGSSNGIDEGHALQGHNWWSWWVGETFWSFTFRPQMFTGEDRGGKPIKNKHNWEITQDLTRPRPKAWRLHSRLYSRPGSRFCFASSFASWIASWFASSFASSFASLFVFWFTSQ